MRATRAVIHLDYLRKNISLVKEGTKRLLCMPVKADAYGHGVLPVARAALAAGADYLAVATVREGEELREGGVDAPVLLLSIPLPAEINALVGADLEVLAGDADYLDALESAAGTAGKRVPVHLKIDTGMGRIGCTPESAPDLAEKIARSRHMRLAGCATHLAVSDSLAAADIAYTKQQIALFTGAVGAIKARGIDPAIVHAANTGAVTFHEDSWFTMVRPGILLYGYPPEGKSALIDTAAIRPLMELKTNIVYIKFVRKGQSVSYGRIWTAAEDTHVGTLPLGYADGLSRLLSNNWSVLAGNRLCPLAGRICMDQCMIDLGAEPPARWDEVSVFGGGAPHAGILARRINTIPYEVTCGINKRVPRVYA
ncbi:MAG: alanine racemase [Treponema sp.]|jgi:alanine racemase|nr:alanine racemase [Treponema sp.]